jgi:hypothetical protein
MFSKSGQCMVEHRVAGMLSALKNISARSTGLHEARQIN